MFKRIVAAVDSDSPRAELVSEATRELARKFDSAVLVVHVRELERVSALATAGRPGLPPVVTLESDEQCRRMVDDTVAHLRAAGVDARGTVSAEAGSTARELLDTAEDFQADLIVVGDRDSHVTDVVLGGVSHRVVHLANCPVLLVR